MLRGILSIQSEVVYGHVGNSAARLALQRLSHEVFCIPTVLFSNHPGHGHHTGEAFPFGQMAALVEGLETNGYLRGISAVISGYLGDPAQAGVIADTVGRVKTANPNAVYCCDPVAGDWPNGSYVSDAVAGAIVSQLLPMADIATPNVYELSRFTDHAVTDPESAVAAARELGPELVLVTSVPGRDPDQIATIAVTPKAAWLTETPRRENVPHGLGDLMTALFMGQWLRSRDIPGALGLAASSVDAILRASLRASAHEILIVQEQNRIVEPTYMRPMVIDGRA